MKALLDVLENYQTTMSIAKGVARHIPGSLDQQSLYKSIPNFFRSILEEAGRDSDYTIKGSFGNGQMAAVPWVAVFNKQVTDTAQRGFYVVLLFAEDMSSCCLSLNQGFTAFSDMFPTKLAQQKVRIAAQRAIALIEKTEGALYGPISLGATKALGKGYELGAIESFQYARTGLPSESHLKSDFLKLIEHYDQLVKIVGASLTELVPSGETEYQYLVNANAKKIRSEQVPRDDLAPRDLPTMAMRNVVGRYIRNPNEAAIALNRAGFQCEIDENHKTFLRVSTGDPYVEAHHLLPLSFQNRFAVSLDVYSNIVALCPNCHRLLHLGLPEQKRGILLRLLESRRDSLAKCGINVSKQELLSFYSDDLVDEAA